MMYQVHKYLSVFFLIILFSCGSSDNNFIWKNTQIVGHQYLEYLSDPSLYVIIEVKKKSDSLPNFYLVNNLDTVKLSYHIESSSLLVFKANKTDFKGETLTDTLYYTQKLPQLVDTCDVYYSSKGGGVLKKIPRAADYSIIFGVKLIEE